MLLTWLTIDIGQFQEDRNENLKFFECNTINITIDIELEEIVFTAQNICLISIILSDVSIESYWYILKDSLDMIKAYFVELISEESS